MLNSSSLADFINSAIRILIIAASAAGSSTVKLTDYKIMQCDYYLKFPMTMLEDAAHIEGAKESIDEYYAFYHWKPDITEYRVVLRYLMAKKLLTRTLQGNSMVLYVITDSGREAIARIDTEYKANLVKLAEAMIAKVKKLSSDTAIEKDIKDKNALLAKKLEVSL